MALITYGDIKASTIPARLNLCSDDDRLRDHVNRCMQWLLLYGSWYGTTQRICFTVADSCIVMPGCVATLQKVRISNAAIPVHGTWHTFLENFTPFDESDTATVAFEFLDIVPSYTQLTTARKLRVFASSASDYGKTITFQGYDENGVPVRSLVGANWQDGETVTLAAPFAQTVTEFATVTAVTKDETNERVTVFSMNGAVPVPFSIYEYWETRPQYQRYKIHGYNTLSSCTVEAQVKLNYQPVRRDGDTLLIHNLPALELAMEALKAKDDGDLAKADALMYGTKANTRMGAIPLLQQELQTYTNNRFSAHVSVHGSAGLCRVMRGFI